jgi:hypothetical protein
MQPPLKDSRHETFCRKQQWINMQVVEVEKGNT